MEQLKQSNLLIHTVIYLNIQVKGDNFEMQTIKRHPICVCVDQPKSQYTHWNNTFNYSSKLFSSVPKIFSLTFEEFHFILEQGLRETNEFSSFLNFL